MNTYTSASMTSIRSQFEAAKAARKAYEDARDEMVKDIIDHLPTTESDPVLNVDLARAAGVTPLHMAAMMGCRSTYNAGVATTTVTKVRRFVEVDENGNVIEGGAIKEQRSELVAYFKGKRRGW